MLPLWSADIASVISWYRLWSADIANWTGVLSLFYFHRDYVLRSLSMLILSTSILSFIIIIIVVKLTSLLLHLQNACWHALNPNSIQRAAVFILRCFFYCALCLLISLPPTHFTIFSFLSLVYHYRCQWSSRGLDLGLPWAFSYFFPHFFLFYSIRKPDPTPLFIFLVSLEKAECNGFYSSPPWGYLFLWLYFLYKSV